MAGIDSVTVPGAVDGWAKAHARFGRLPWKDLFTPAIYYAEHGYPVPLLSNLVVTLPSGQCKSLISWTPP